MTAGLDNTPFDALVSDAARLTLAIARRFPGRGWRPLQHLPENSPPSGGPHLATPDPPHPTGPRSPTHSKAASRPLHTRRPTAPAGRRTRAHRRPRAPHPRHEAETRGLRHTRARPRLQARPGSTAVWRAPATPRGPCTVQPQHGAPPCWHRRPVLPPGPYVGTHSHPNRANLNHGSPRLRRLLAHSHLPAPRPHSTSTAAAWNVTPRPTPRSPEAPSRTLRRSHIQRPTTRRSLLASHSTPRPLVWATTRPRRPRSASICSPQRPSASR
jgi:hypothetical protein